MRGANRSDMTFTISISAGQSQIQTRKWFDKEKLVSVSKKTGYVYKPDIRKMDMAEDSQTYTTMSLFISSKIKTSYFQFRLYSKKFT